MKLGFCTGMENLGVLERAGIDCIELTVGAVDRWTDAEREEHKTRLAASPVRLLSCNSLIGGFSLYEDEDFAQTKAYFDRVLPKLADVGVKILVFGSGGYRRVPEGLDPAAAKEKILAFLRLLSSLIRPYGITVVIEPLNRKECNVLNSAREAAGYVRELDLPNIRLLVDFYHFLLEEERIDEIAEYRGILAHTHTAHPVNRRTPVRGDGMDHAACVRALRDIGYEGLIVCESRVGADLEAEVRGFKAVIDAALAKKH